MIPLVHTDYLLEERDTDGHSPMYFRCDDGEYYFCKYRTQMKKEELDCLVYEIVCSKLLQRLGIPTPEIALAKISAHSLDKSKLKRNKRYVDAGNLCFASKELASADLITGLQMIGNKSQLNRFLEPYGLLKIGMFDLWVDNVDRGKNENYNLLMEAVEMEQENNNMTKKRTMFRWVAFDHAFAFGGVDRLRMFNETMQPTKNKKLVESPYFKSYIKHLNKKTALNIVRNFLNLTPNEIKDIIDNVFSQLPEMWQTPASLSSRMSRFLADPQRLKTVKHLTISTIK